MLMKKQILHSRLSRKPSRMNSTSGQALIEFATVALFLIVLVMGLIDFGRAIMIRQVMASVSREGSNLASRGTSTTNALAAVIGSAQPLNITQKGFVIMTTVLRDNAGVVRITTQQSQGGQVATSKIGAGVGTVLTAAPFNGLLPPTNQTMVVTEVFYNFAPVTPIGKMLKFTFPSKLYDVAFF